MSYSLPATMLVHGDDASFLFIFTRIGLEILSDIILIFREVQ
jgi:hypothetical protein